MNQLALILNRAKQAILSRDFEFAEKLLTSPKTKSLTGEDNKDVLLLLGSLYLKSGDFNKALSVFEKLHSIDPNNIEILNNLGIIYRQLRQYEKSISVLLKARNAGDNSPTLLYNLGNTYKEMHSYDEAARCFQEVLEMDPTDVLAYNHLGTIEFLNANYDKALQAYKHGLQRDPNHPFIHFNLARLYRMQGKNSDAEKEYNTAIKNQPAWIQVLKELASLYDITGETDKRKETLKKILSINASDVFSLVEYAEIESTQEHYESAKKFFEMAVKAAGSDMKPSMEYARFLHSRGQTTEAASVLEKFNKDYPGSMEVLLDLAELYLTLFQYPKAREIFNECDKIDENNLKLLSLKGKLYVAMGDQDRARFYLAKILTIAPGKVEFRLEFAEQLAETGLLPEAEEQLVAYLEEKPEDHGARILLGAIYEQMKDFEKAAACYMAVIAVEKDNIQANSALSLLYQRTGKTAEAVRLADEIVNLQGGRANEKDLSSLEESLSLYEQAVNHYKISNPGAASRNLKMLQPEEPQTEKEPEEEKTSPEVKDHNEDLEEDDMLLDIEDEEPSLEEELYDENLDDILDNMENLEESGEEEEVISQDENPFLEEIPETFEEKEPHPSEEGAFILPSEEEKPREGFPQYPPQYPQYPPQYMPQIPPAWDSNPYSGNQIRNQGQNNFEKPEVNGGTDRSRNNGVDNSTGNSKNDDNRTEKKDLTEKEDSIKNPGNHQDLNKGMLSDDIDFPFSRIYKDKNMQEEEHHAARNDLGPMPPFGFPMRSPVLDSPELDIALSNIPGKNLLELLKYIRGITEFLPDKLFSAYLVSDERLILEYMIYKLSGNPGIRYNNLAKAVYGNAKARGLLKKQQSGENMLSGTFSFLESLVSELPDKGFSALLKKRIDDIKTHIDSQDQEDGRQ